MENIVINFKNCHGISKFNETLNFNNGESVILIYAPNGTMKTSFANTFKDLINGNEPRNYIHEKTLLYTVKINGNMLKKDYEFEEKILVMDSISDDFNFEDSTPLISNLQCRQEYLNIVNHLEDLKIKFFKKIRDKTKIKISKGSSPIDFIENVILNDFNCDYSFLDLISKLNIGESCLDLSDFEYDMLFNDKVLKILQDKEIQDNLYEYISKYNDLTEKSKIFNKNDFYHYNAQDLVKSIEKNNLFNANHKIKFYWIKDPVTNLDELNNVFNNEVDKFFNNEELKDHFDKIIKKFSNAATKNFKKILMDNQYLIPKLKNIDNFKKEYWMSIFKKFNSEFKELRDEYKSKRLSLIEIEKKAIEERTSWNEILDLFNSRFDLPFTLKLGNKAKVVCKLDVPEIKFLFKENNKEIPLEILKKFYSSGQKRALYLLNMLYNLEMASNKITEKDNGPKLLIMDDIADSFDYKNKYSIIEYLNDLSKDNSFKIILLTHNFDFLRTVKSRLNCKNTYFAQKTDYDIRLKNLRLPENIFIELKKRINDSVKEGKDKNCYKEFISTIPFVRNLLEYHGRDEDKNFLTNLLHYKNKGRYLKFNDLEKIYNEFNISIPKSEDTIYNIVEKEAKKVFNSSEDKLNIVNKIVLSMAIRINAEKFMMAKLNVSSDDIKKNQTRELFNKYKMEYDNQNELDILEKVNMMTPENIHINSFMYEPILDMDENHLNKLYKEVEGLNNGN